MNCANCGAPLRPEPGRHYLVCDACRSIVHAEPNADGVVLLGEESDFSCPVCRTQLVEAAIVGQRVLHCLKCRGSLVGVEEFVFLAANLGETAGAASVPRPLEEAELRRVVICPRCSRRMDTHPYAGPGNIVIDNCPQCGVNWLDYRELRRVATAP